MLLYTVHAMKPSKPGAVEVIYTERVEAVRYAKERSTDHNVLSASVTSFKSGQLGSRRPVCWFVQGVEQRHRFEREIFPTGRFPMSDWPTELLIERFIDLSRAGGKSPMDDEVFPELKRRLTPEELAVLVRQ